MQKQNDEQILGNVWKLKDANPNAAFTDLGAADYAYLKSRGLDQNALAILDGHPAVALAYNGQNIRNQSMNTATRPPQSNDSPQASRSPQASPAPHEKHSQFVTIFAWINIVVCGLSVVACFGLMLLFKAVVPIDEILASLQNPDLQQAAPAALVYVLRHIQTLLALSLAASVVMLIASHALLKRRNWARLFWVVVMGLVAVWSIGGVFFHPDVSRFLPPALNNQPPEIQAQMQAMIATIRIYGSVLSLVQGAVFAWATWRFCSQDIRREFHAD